MLVEVVPIMQNVGDMKEEEEWCGDDEISRAQETKLEKFNA